MAAREPWAIASTCACSSAVNSADGLPENNTFTPGLRKYTRMSAETMVPSGTPSNPTTASAIWSVRPQGFNIHSPMPHASWTTPNPRSTSPTTASNAPALSAPAEVTATIPTRRPNAAPSRWRSARTVTRVGRFGVARPPTGVPQ